MVAIPRNYLHLIIYRLNTVIHSTKSITVGFILETHFCSHLLAFQSEKEKS